MKCFPHKIVLAAHLAPALLCCVSCEPTVAKTKGGIAEQPAINRPPRLETILSPSDLYYGIYLQGNKVGWMRSRVKIDASVTTQLNLEASVRGLGQVSKISIDESRVYDGSSRRIQSLQFSQRAQTGEMSVRVERQPKGLNAVVSAGGVEKSMLLQSDDSLDNLEGVKELASRAKVGESIVVRHFDASLLKTVKIRHAIVAVEERVFAGVPTATVQMESTYEELGITETSWVDREGRLLESKVGGFFVARLEPESVAKKLDYSQDILISAVVKAPGDFSGAQQASELSLVMEGFGATTPPASKRQGVKLDGKRTHLKLRREKAPRGLFVPHKNRDHADLQSTPFIQSESPLIKEQVAKLIDGPTPMMEVLQILTSFVYRHIRDEYVPSYSNALEALNSARGDCTEHSVLFVALARALGLPARVAVGVAYWPAGKGFGWHAWAEVLHQDEWISVDPTWNQPVADVTHIKLAGGSPAEQARIVMLLGELTILEASFGG